MEILDKVKCYAKCYGGYVAALFAGWELCKGDMIVALPVLAVAAYLAYCNSESCPIK
jgi:hypothetical protein